MNQSAMSPQEAAIHGAGQAAKEIITKAVSREGATTREIQDAIDKGVDHAVATGTHIYHTANDERLYAKREGLQLQGKLHEVIANHGKQILFACLAGGVLVGVVAWVFS